MNDHWSSRMMFILAAIGSAVGLGNIWRFSYMAGEYGGGSFILIYIISVILLGLPIMILEFTAGKHFAAPLSNVFGKISKKLAIFSLIPHALNFIILSYYIVVTGCTLAYLFSSLFGHILPLEEYSQQHIFLVFTPISLLLVLIIMRTSLKNGIEKANRFMMPVFFIILIAMAAYSLTLPGLGKAISFFTDFRSISTEGALAAVTQTLFSLSVGVGIMLTYSSHLQKKERIASSAAIIALADTSIALIAGIAIFPIVFTYGLNPAGGATLAFNTLPIAFMQMPFGNIIMPAFFLLLFSVAMTSVISMAEVMVADLSQSNSRETSALLAVAAIALASIPSLLSYSFVNLQFMGFPILDFLDGSVVVSAYPPVALMLILVLGWGWRDFEKESKKAIPQAMFGAYVFLIRFFIPIALAALTAAKLLS